MKGIFKEKLITIGLYVALVSACSSCDEKSNVAEKSVSGTEQQQAAEAPDQRDAYLNPYEVFEKLNGVGGKVVADLNAGDGYFSWKLVNSGARVIAICKSQAELEALEKGRSERNISKGDMEIRLADMASSGLKDGEVDYAFLTQGLAGMDNSKAFLLRTKKGMKPGSLFVSFEWKPIETPIGPETSIRYSSEQAMDVLFEGGFNDVTGLSKLLPYHNVMVGTEYVGDPNAL